MSDEPRSKFLQSVLDEAWQDSGFYGEPDKYFLAGFQEGIRLNGGRMLDLIDRLAGRIEDLELKAEKEATRSGELACCPICGDPGVWKESINVVTKERTNRIGCDACDIWFDAD